VSLKIILGIGNPGREHEGTRHNVGFRVVDRIARSTGAEFGRKRFKGLMGEGTFGGTRLLLVKPQTYVNLSGECAREVLDYHEAGLESFLVVTDDVNLPLGGLRFRPRGSSGGHRGLESIIGRLGTDEFPRLRVGVGRPGAQEDDLVGHVLGTFSRDEAELAERAEDRAAEAALEWVRSGPEVCMNLYNRPAEAGDAPQGRP
jgi:PTH1 family peptidyl-tRNA hydrolase